MLTVKQKTKTHCPTATTETVLELVETAKLNVESEVFQRAKLVKGDHVTPLPYWYTKTAVTLNPSEQWALIEECAVNTAADGPPVFAPYSAVTGCYPKGSKRNPLYARQLSCTVKPTSFAPLPNVSTLPVFSAAERTFCKQMSGTSALSKINKSLVNLPMAIKERKATLALAIDKVGQLARVTRALHERDLKRLSRYKPGSRNWRRLSRLIANEHLAFVFGVLPLIGEVEGAMEYVMLEDLSYIKVHGSHTIKRAQGVPFGVTSLRYANQPYSWNTFRVESRGNLVSSITVRTSLRYEVVAALLMDARRLGADPISTFYDMVPLSFVSGWVSNFDKFVRTISPKFGLSYVSGSTSTRVSYVAEMEARLKCTHQNPGNTVIATVLMNGGGWVPYSSLNQRTDRVVIQEPSASLHWDVDIGVFEILAGLSLMAQRYIKPLQRAISASPFRYRGPRPRDLPDIRYRKI